MNSSFLFRTRIIAFFVVFISFIFLGRLFYLQVLKKNTYEELAKRQYITPSAGVFDRGSILFEKKDKGVVSASSQMSGFKIEVNPMLLKDKEEVYKKISSVVELDKEEFFLKVNKENDPSEEIIKRLNKEEADKILALKISGLKVVKDKWRYYPGGNLASHSIGFVAFNENNLEGRYGLEKEYDSVLARDENNPYLNFFAEVFTNLKKSIFNEEDRQGDILTTIEPEVQLFLEKELLKVKEKYQTDLLGGIIINPKNGEIYAISAKPDFDLNNFNKEKDTKIFANPFVESVFEFGSVVKPLVMASGFDAGVITPETSYNDTGSVLVEKKLISNFDKKGRGPNTTMEKVIGQSLNTGMVLIYQKLGKEKFRDYMYSFGIKEKTGIDLPNETIGLVSNLNSKRELEYANASFGQGIAMTPINLVRALSALANGGELITPHLVKSIHYKNGKIENIEYEKQNTKISKEASTTMTSLLVNTMDKYLSEGKKKFENYSVAVKTGTAQIANNETGGYYKDRNMHSFFGYFPAYDPDFLVFLFAVHPKGSPYASLTWTEPFVSVTKFLLNYYNVPPDR